MNKQNLLQLAEYLETLPEDYEHFEMSDFMQDGDPTTYAKYALENGSVAVTTCGAAACAIGHGPSAGFLFLESELEKDEIRNPKNRDEWIDILKPDWFAYSSRVFLSQANDEWRWDFMFGGSWSSYDNSPWGAAARIRFVVNNPDMDFVELYYDKDTEIYADYRKQQEIA